MTSLEAAYLADSRRQGSYFACRKDPLQPLAVRREAVLYLAQKAAYNGGHLSADDELLYRRVLAPISLIEPMRAFYDLVFEVSAPGVEVLLDRILPSQS